MSRRAGLGRRGALVVAFGLGLAAGCDGASPRRTSDATRARAAGDAVLADLHLEGAVVVAAPARQRRRPAGIDRICGPAVARAGATVNLSLTLSEPDARTVDLLVRTPSANTALRVTRPVADGRTELAVTLGAGQPAEGVDLTLEVAVVEADGGVGAGNRWTASRAQAGTPSPSRHCTYGPVAGVVAAVALTPRTNREAPADSASLPRLAVGANDGSVWVYDTDTGRLLARLSPHTAPAGALALADDGRDVVAVGGADGVLRGYDLALDPTGAEPGIAVPIHREAVRVVGVFRASDQRLRFVTAGWDGDVHLLALPEGAGLDGTPLNPDGTLPNRQTWPAGDRVNAVAASPDGRYLAAAIGRLVHPGRLRVWAVETGAVVLDAELDDFATAVAFVDDGRTVVVGTGRGQLAAWSIPEGVRRAADFEGGSGDIIVGLVQLARGALGAAAVGPLLSVGLDGRISLWRGPTGGHLQTQRLDRSPVVITVPADGSALAAGDDQGYVTVVDLEFVAEP